MIDYLTLMLINTAAGFFVLGIFVFKDFGGCDQKAWAPVFALSGLISALCGLRMTWTWPLPGSYNVAFGEMSILFGGLLLAAALAVSQGWNLKPLAIYGFFAGLAAAVVGVRFIHLGLSKAPLLTGVGFMLAGLGGMFAWAALHWRTGRLLRLTGALVCILSSAIWARIGYQAYWDHLASFMKS